MSIKCIVVCEGSSDFPFIEGVIQHVAKSREIDFKAILVTPELDATGTRYEQCGYEGVKNWCKHKAALLQRSGKDQIGALLAWHSADFLLIHMDADIADKIDIDGQKFEGSIEDREPWCKNALDTWVGICKEKVNLQYVIPTWQIESWLLSTYDEVFFEGTEQSMDNCEKIQHVEPLLLSLGYKEDKEKPGRLYKEMTLYQNDPRYVPRLMEKLDVASNRCSALYDFINRLNAYGTV